VAVADDTIVRMDICWVFDVSGDGSRDPFLVCTGFVREAGCFGRGRSVDLNDTAEFGFGGKEEECDEVGLFALMLENELIQAERRAILTPDRIAQIQKNHW
jgi:hypothetical protein